MNTYVYDIEVFPNFFCACFEDYFSDEKHYFEISLWRDDREELIKFIKNTWLVGYNNNHYDNVIINYIASKKCSNEELYAMSQKSINNDYEGIKKYKYNNSYVSVDILTMLFSKAQRVSLKEMQVNINWPKVQDLPLHFTHVVKEEEVELIKDYCFNDVASTKAIAKMSGNKIDFRIKIEKQFNIKCLSKDDVNLGVSLFEKFYEEDSGDDTFKQLRSKRTFIKLGECISDKVHFKSDAFNNLLNILKNKSITKTKGALKYSVIYGGIKYVFGTGGIHSKDKPLYIVPKDDEFLEDADVSSLYPSLLILLEACPEHLDPRIFLPRYKGLRDSRVKLKKEGEKLISEIFKLSLNGVYGNLINEHSWLYDPMQAMKITLNGQLFIAMLGERLTDGGFKVISVNTDGITVLMKKHQKAEYDRICKEWEEYTKLELEFQGYKKIVRRDVNTYFAEFTNGYIKEKGSFLTSIKLGKGYDKPIIQKALKAYFFENIPIKTFIENHDNIYDFCMMQKMGKSESGNMFRAMYKNEILQKTNRFYATKNPNAGYLYKIEDNVSGKEHVLKDSGVIIFNDYVEKSIKDYDINYNYYIKEAEKLRVTIEPIQSSLF